QQSDAEGRAAPGIEGTVNDPAGVPIPRAVVRLEPEFASSSRAPLTAIKTITDKEGKYALAAPAAGQYTLHVTADGFKTFAMKDVSLKSAERRRIDLVLQIGIGGPTVEVSPAAQSAPSVEFSDAPNFAVAGITDRSNMGLHGSDANTRTSDVLAKET